MQGGPVHSDMHPCVPKLEVAADGEEVELTVCSLFKCECQVTKDKPQGTEGAVPRYPCSRQLVLMAHCL